MKHISIQGLLLYLLPTAIVFIVLGSGYIYQSKQITKLTKDVENLSLGLASTTFALSQNTRDLAQNIDTLSKESAGISKTLSSTQQYVDAVKNQVGGVEQTVGSISGTVGVLQKLSQVDPQLLKKYSKVYFMNENYTPAHLTVVPQEYVYSTTRQEQFLTESWPFLKRLFDDAKANGVTLYIKSGYRSFSEQKSLKTTYSVIYGAGTANSFSADQGYSEHQLGTTLDFMTSGIGGDLSDFDGTVSYQWLLDNAHRYGFILSYPKGNNYYVYEPWHWRYVGIKLATYLHDKKINFYDLDQREIDTYLANTFDQ